jgi:cell division septum initiation protein DivIVA
MRTSNAPPTKDQELAALDHMIATLGPDSYIGAWMKAGTRDGIERDLRSDWPIDARLPHQISTDARAEANAITDRARAQSLEIISRAHTTAAGIITAAETKAKKEIERAQADAASIRADVHRALTDAGFRPEARSCT